MPAMIKYGYGQGKVVVLTFFTDWYYGHGGWTQNEINLIRDLVSWAQGPDTNISEYKEGEQTSKEIEVRNDEINKRDTTQVELKVYDPDGNLQSTLNYELPVPLSPGASTTVPFTYIVPSGLGIYWIEYSLKDFEGNLIQADRKGGRFAVKKDLVIGNYPVGSFQIWAEAPSEYVTRASTVTFTIFVNNNTDLDFTGGEIWAGAHEIGGAFWTIKGIISNVSVPAHSQRGFQFSVVLDYSTTMYFGLFAPETGRDTRFFYQGAVTVCERGVWVREPSVEVGVATDKNVYRKGEEVGIVVGLKNRQEASYDVTVKTIVKNPANLKVFEESHLVSIPSDGSTEERVSFILPSDAMEGCYTLQVGVYHGTGMAGFSSTFLEVASAFLRLSMKLPDVFIPNLLNPISFDVENVGIEGVPEGQMTVKLCDPDKYIVWADTKTITNLLPNSSTTVSFSLALDEIKYGDYELKYALSYGSRVMHGATQIPCKAVMRLCFDKTSYRVREELNANLELVNTGKFKQELKVVAEIPDCEFSQTQNLELSPGDKTTLTYSLLIPPTTGDGSHVVNISLYLYNSTLSESYAFFIPSAKLEFSLDKLNYFAGETGILKVKNTGGADARYDYTLKIVDQRNVAYWEKKNTISTIEADSLALIPFTVPDQLASGWYILWIVFKDLETGKETWTEKYIEVGGLNAVLEVSTDKKVYLNTENITGKASLENLGQPLSGANLNIKAYSAGVGWTNYTNTNSILSIAVDENYVWFGTRGGVKRYDEINDTWKTYTTADGLMTNYSIDCTTVDDNYIWFGSWGLDGIGRYDKVNDTWKTYTTADGLASDSGPCIAVDGNYVWFGSFEQGVSRYDRVNDNWEYFTKADGLASDWINSIAIDGNYVWFGTDSGVSKYDKVNNTWQTFTMEDGLSSNYIQSVAVYGDFVWLAYGYWGSIWSWSRGGVSRYDKLSKTWKTFTTADGLASKVVNIVAVDGNYIWCGTEGGVSKYDKEKDTWETFTTADGLLSNVVTSIGVNGKYVWFGTGKGVSRYEKNAAWRTFTANELVYNYVKSAVVDGDYIWFGTLGGVSRYDKINDNWQSYTIADGLIHEYVYDIAVDDDYVWFGTYRGLNRYNKLTGEWKNYLEGNRIEAIAVDGNYVWFGTGTSSDGVRRYNKVDGTWKTYTTADGLAIRYVSSITIDGNYVWFETSGGAVRYDKVDGTWKIYTVADGLATDAITAITIDGDYVWFGTTGGLSRYHKPSNTWRTFTTADGLAANRINVNSVTVDGEYLWVGAFQEGVSRYNKTSGTWQTFTTNDGLAGKTVNSIAVDGIYTWFGTSTGASRYQKLGPVVWEKDIPVSGSGQINLACDIGVINDVGKFYLEGTLTSSMGQEIARASNSFYLTTSDIFLIFNTDKRVYKPGETVTITGEVTNGGELAETNLRFVLKKGNGEQIYTETFDLQPGEKRTFIATTIANNCFFLEGIVGDVEISDYVPVESANVEIRVVGPDVVGQEPFELSILLNNTGKHNVDLSLDFAGEISTMTLAVGESRLFQRNFIINQDTTFQINLSGDVEKMVTKLVKFGGEIILSLEPEEVYPEGTVEVPFTITNSGSVDMELDFAFTLMKGTVTWADTAIRPYYIPAEGGVFDSLIYENMDEGNYVLEYKGLVSGSALIRVAKFNVVEIEEIIVNNSQFIGGKIPVEIMVKNVGANDFMGSLRLDTGFFKEDRNLNLNIGERKTVTFNVGVGVACGGYEAIAQVFHNGNVIAEATESFVLMPDFSLVSVPSALSFDVGQQATVTMTIKNTGPVGGTAEVSLSCGDIVDQTKTVWLDAGEVRELSFSFTIADDLWEKDYIAMVKLRNLESGLRKISEIPFHINGYNVSVSASLDKDLYAESEIAKLTLEITNGNPQFTPTIFAKVVFNSFSQTTPPFVLETASSLEFDVPVHFTGQKLSYGVYTESGRALYLNSIYIYEKGKVVSLLTDKQVYNMGEPINVTVVPETTGYFEISAPNCVTGLSLSTTDQFNLSWNLPLEMVSGTNSIEYSLADTEGSHRFDVIGYSVRILEANLDKERYLNGEKMALRLRIDSNRDISVASFKGWVLSQGDKFDCFDSTGVLKQGESTLEIEGEMLASEKGVARLVYTISKPVDGGEKLLLVSGAEGFDVVLPDDTPPVSEIHIYGHQYVDAITTHTYVSSRTTFTITAVDPEVDAFASGVADIYYRINVSTLTPAEWKVYTSSFSISGEGGDYIIEYYGIDNMDNKEEIKSLAVTLDNTPPETVLISPSPDSEGVCKIFSGIFPVIGTADGEQFDRYELAFASGTMVPLNFLTIEESTNPVTDSGLGLWDTTGLEQGYYTLRLSAWDKVENLGMSTVTVFVGEPEFLFAYAYTPEFEPAYIAIDKENYSYVTNHKPAGMVVKFDSDGNVVDVFGRPSRGEKRLPAGERGDWHNNVALAVPEGIAVDSQGNMWVADRLHNRVVKLDPQGNLLMQIGGEGFGKWDGSHRRWSQPDGIAGHREFTFNWPVGVALDEQGNVYVADRFNNRIQKFTPEGELVEEATIHTSIFDKDHPHWRDHWGWWNQKLFYRPGGIALDGSGDLYVADQVSERVLKFNPQGELVLVIGTGEDPDGIIVTQEGYIYVTDQGNNRIQKFDKYGNLIMEWGRGKEKHKGYRRGEIPGGEFDSPGGIAFDSDGNVYVVDRGNGRVQVFGLPREEATQDVVRSLSRVAADVSGPDPTFKLGEVYSFPNPAKRGKWPTIHFESGIADRVEINIYDIAGELIHSLEITDKPEVINNKYAYEYGWNVSNIASGVYIYLIRAKKSGEKEIKVVKKLAVVK
jgi:ligand-binding sensor domain-containing protein